MRRPYASPTDAAGNEAAAAKVDRPASRTATRPTRTSSSPSSSRPPALSAILTLSAALLLTDQSVVTVTAAPLPYGYQSGYIPTASGTSGAPSSTLGQQPDERSNDDTHAGSLYYSPADRLLYITGGTYGGYFNAGPTQQPEESHLDESDCFVGVLRAPTTGGGGGGGGGSVGNAVPELLFTRRYGNNAIPDVCSAVSPVTLTQPPTAGTSSEGEGSPYHLLAIGHTEEGGLMTDLRRTGADKAISYGYVLDLEINRNAPGGGKDSGVPQGAEHVGGRLFHESEVQYPIAIAVPPKFEPSAASGGTSSSDTTGQDRDAAYVVLQMTDKNGPNPKFDTTLQNPDLTAGGGGGVQHYGHGQFGLKIKKLGWKYQYGETDLGGPAGGPSGNVRENMVTLYTQEYATVDSKTVRASNLIYVPHLGHDGQPSDFLLLAGYTQGYGAAFGSLEPGTNDSDGFLTKIDPNTGLEVKKVSDMTNSEAMFANSFSMRLATQEGMSEVIHGVCIPEGVDDVRDAYVVGSTTGVLAPDATVTDDADVRQMFVVRLDLDTLNIEWRRQVGTVGGQDAYATGCAVDSNSGAVYVGGVVEDGGVLAGNGVANLVSGGMGDVFLIRLGGNDGKVDWARQIGTEKDERLATGGGVAVDEDGDAVLFGTTRGSMMRMRGRDYTDPNTGDVKSPSDAFVMSVSKGGDHRVPVESLTGGGDYNPNAPGEPNFPDQPSGSVPTSPNTPPSQSIGMSDSSPEGSKMSSAGIFSIAVVAAMTAVGVFFFAYRYGVRKAEDSFHARHSNDHVTQYLKEFDDIDIALRQSATGGWHGMYDLAGEEVPQLGKVPQEVMFDLGVSSLPGDETASISKSSIASNSSVVKDALFFDDEEELSPRGGRGADGLFQIEDDDDDEGGGPGGQDGGKWGAGYAGLVESYNESWADRSPHSMGGLGGHSGGLGGGGDGGGFKDKPDDKEIV